MWDFHRLFRMHAPEINRFLRRRGHNTETAADLTQDTFLRLVMAAPQGANHNSRAYLHQIARNLSVDLGRRERCVEFVALPDEEFNRVADPLPTPETIAYDRQRLMIVERALRELPDRTRQAFEMHRLESKTLKEVAAELELSTSRTWALVRQAYLQVHASLRDETN